MMNVLVACECSGVIRRAFRERGHNAYSCDLKPAEDDSLFHIQGDALSWIDWRYWDLLIAHPECRRLCNSGVLRLYLEGKKVNGIDADKWEEMEAAARFFVHFLKAPARRIVVENSVMHGYAQRRLAPFLHGWKRQIIQPHQFGADASKATLLLLKNVEPLKPTKLIAPRIVNGRPRWANQTDSGQNRLAPSEQRSSDRARTYPGIAEAMADQII